MTETQGAPRNRSTLTPWIIGCGLLIVVGILGVFGAGWVWLQSAMLTEPAEISTLADEIVPGAKAPEGLVAMWGVDTWGYKVAVFGPEYPDGEPIEAGDPGTNGARGMVIVLATGPQDDGTAEEMMEGEIGEDVDLERIGTEKKVVGGVELDFEKSRSVQDGTEMLHYSTTLPIPGGRFALLKILGPKDRFDHDAMKEFLAGIESLAKPRSEEPEKAGQPGKDKE